ncbi:hypothetical protein EVAR_37300_1 [Eumeta japonica]|uniref:Reverse transcriptase domain-containing protein n=1 Tax=Eumeta variegata TaxID=151549 RepID=A0A4C1WXF8_EUMVA|nr:hypothetical protein EVAR_37300_1 [Eumeta japonica]
MLDIVQNDTIKSIRLRRGTKYGNVVSLELFAAASGEGVEICKERMSSISTNGEHISHLGLADDLLIMAEALDDLDAMLGNLNRISLEVGIQMNINKSKT